MNGLKPKKSFKDEQNVLFVHNASFAWPSGIKALDQCSFSIPNPGLWMIVGSNGSGKSTLFRLISGMLELQDGESAQGGDQEKSHWVDRNDRLG